MPIDTGTPGGFPRPEDEPEEHEGTTTGTTLDVGEEDDATTDDATTTGDGHPPRVLG